MASSPSHLAPRPARSVTPAGVLAGHLVVAAFALGTGVVLIWAGTRPGAGLEALYAPVGWGVVLASLAFGAVAVVAARVARRDAGRTARLSGALGWVEIGAGAVGAVSAGISIASYPTFTPWRSPALPPAVALAALGIAAVACARRSGPGHPTP